MSKATFEQSGIDPQIAQSMAEMGYENLTPIQEQAIPIALEGRDIIGQAQTGTGKTAAFAIPMMQILQFGGGIPRGIVLCPTRELALQVSGEMEKIGRYLPVRVVSVYGGASIEKQIQELSQGADIIVGTPGRIQDLLDRGKIKLGAIEIFTLDEADEMLNMGFRDDIENILNQAPEECQKLFFSATIDKNVRKFSNQYLVDPEEVAIRSESMTVDQIQQSHYLLRNNHEKLGALIRLLEYYNLKQALVFCNTKRMVDKLAQELTSSGYPAEALHGDMRQNQRESVMGGYRSGRSRILVATDVAARGIDVNDIEGVVNYDVPPDAEFYVHRIGRTGRAGRSGYSFTLLTKPEYKQLRAIENYANITIPRGDLPERDELENAYWGRFAEELRESAQRADEDSSLANVMALLKESGITGEEILKGMLQREKEALQMRMAGQEQRRAPQAQSSNGSNGSNGHHQQRREKNQPKPRRETDTDMVRLRLNIGRKFQIRPKDIVGAFAGESGIPGKRIGAIDIFDHYSLVDVPEEDCQLILDSMNQSQIKGRQVQLEPADED